MLTFAGFGAVVGGVLVPKEVATATFFSASGTRFKATDAS